jgi:predicted metal-binding membrane protein
MDKAQKMVIAALIGTSAVARIASIQQPDMMTMMAAMTTYDPMAISLFTASWTAGMAAMMFPAITPMVLLYNRFVANKEGKGGGEGAAVGGGQSSVLVQADNNNDEEKEQDAKPKKSSPSSSLPIRSLRVILFVGCYLLVWALTGIALLVGWSAIMNNTIMATTAAAATGNSQLLPGIYGALLIIAGAYQFTPLKRTCIGYCESPMSFFMRRWKDGTLGAVRMGLWHGLYCLGCCWTYFLLMVALGWMSLLWMGLFAGIIFGEKMWRRGGIWIARAAGVGLAITGILVISGMLPSLVSPSSSLLPPSMSEGNGDSGGDASMTRMMKDNNNGDGERVSSNNNNNSSADQSMQSGESHYDRSAAAVDSSSSQQASGYMNMR